jgi:hypothetical protein
MPTPRDDLGDRQWRVPELIAERLRGAFSAAADTPAVDDHVPGVSFALDLDLAERDKVRLHGRSFARGAGNNQRGSASVLKRPEGLATNGPDELWPPSDPLVVDAIGPW